tara:strand:- start:122 stop:1249 length:1128 start_codon:yes stop_codon:yes gene_type:complete
MKSLCNVCKSNELRTIFKHSKIPKYNLNYYNNINKSLNSKFEKVNFVICKKCNFVFNSKYKELNYLVEYNANRSNSKVFNTYLNKISNDLFLYLKNIKSIVEVGAGDCIFANKLVKLYKKKIKYYAFDVSWLLKKNITDNKTNLKIIKIPDYYNKKYNFDVDLLILRHVLEHQYKVTDFLRKLLFKKPKYIFIEIPCWEFVKKNNYHYFSNEHCSYFSKENINYLMNLLGYKKIFLKFDFNKEYIISLWVINTKRILKINTEKKINFIFLNWKNKLKKLLKDSVIWGAGGKGVMLINILDLNSINMTYILDINPDLNNKFIPGTDIQIMHPKNINSLNFKYKTIYVINILYLNEVINIIKRLKIKTKVKYLFNNF